MAWMPLTLILASLAVAALGLYIAARCHVAVLRDRLGRLAAINAELTDTLDTADHELAYHQDVETRLREVIQRLFGDNAVTEIDQTLWSADLICGLDKDTKEWLERES